MNLKTRHIILMRHGQSAEKQAGQKDPDRTLTADGEARVRKTGRALLSSALRPDFILSSSAVRAKQTAHGVNESLHLTSDQMTFRDELYEASTGEWERTLDALPDNIHCVLCVGHNPTLSAMASEFAGHPIDLEPGGYVLFACTPDSWSSFRKGLKEITSSASHRWTMR